MTRHVNGNVFWVRYDDFQTFRVVFAVIIIFYGHMCYYQNPSCQLTFQTLPQAFLLSYYYVILECESIFGELFHHTKHVVVKFSSVAVTNKRGSRGYKEFMASKMKTNKGGNCLRYEPMHLKLLNEDPTTMEVFWRMGCLQFCQKLQGFHAQVSKGFVTNFTGTTSKFWILNLIVSPESISQATKIPRGGQEWCKGTKFTMQGCEEFLRKEHKGVDLTNGILGFI